jgi:hypothetical protein
MALQRTVPSAGTIVVRTYEEFRHFVHQFVAGRFHLLMLLGSPGVAKSQTVTRAIGNRAHLYLDTHATAFGMYCQLHLHRDLPTVIDDLDHLYGDRACVRLLKSLCNTDAVKTLRWPSAHPKIGDGPDQVPAAFTTRSPVCLIANEWRTLNANVQAIEDRAIIASFQPSVGEVHVEVRQWFSDAEVYDFMEQHLPYITQPSMRYYVKGAQLRQACPDRWQEQLLTLMGVDEARRAIVGILSDATLHTEAARVAAFEAKGLGDRATYFRWKKKLQLAH